MEDEMSVDEGFKYGEPYEWFCATVAFGEGPFDWAYVEIKGRDQAHAWENLVRMVGAKAKINYMEMM